MLMLEHWPLLTSLFLAGVVDSIGGGGGLISVPALITAQVPLPLLLGTNKSLAAPGAAVSLFRYARAGLLPVISRPSLFFFILLGALGGFSGAVIAQLPWVVRNLRFLIPILLVFVIAYLTKRWFFNRGCRPLESHLLHSHESRLASFGIATYDGVFGPGTGSFFLSYFERAGLPTLSASAFTKVLNLSSNLGALLFFTWKGAVLWPVGFSGAGVMILGNYVGSGLALKKGQSLVRATVLIMSSLMLFKYAWASLG